MKLAVTHVALTVVCLTVGSLSAQRPSEPSAATEVVDEQAVAAFKKYGLEQSQVMDHLSWICDVYGPRLTGSTNLQRAQDWAVGKFKEFGVEARTEAWGPFGRGWRCDHFLLEVVGDNPWPVLAYPKAWSPSVEGRIEGEVVLVAGLEADVVKAMDLEGKLVLVEEPRPLQEPFEAPSKRLAAEELLAMADQRADAPQRGVRPRREGARPAEDFRSGFARREALARILATKKPLALLDRGFKGDYGTVFVQGASVDAGGGSPEQRQRARDAGAAVTPQLTLAVEHYNRLCRLLEKGIAVRLALELRTTFSDQDVMERNVIGEIPGADPALGKQLVMVGAHFDSWQAGTGCTDNGCGSAVVIEAARLVAEHAKQANVAPRRTIRFALWSGEEQGLLGSRAYVKQHFGEREGRGDDAKLTLQPDHALLSGYFNLDNGTGRIRGVYLEGNAAVAPIFRAWLRPFHDLDASTLTLNPTGGTDHQSFDAIGLPGFQFIQDPVSYSTKTHHSNMDVWDHAVAEDLRQAATVMATFAWHTAQRDAMLPRGG